MKAIDVLPPQVIYSLDPDAAQAFYESVTAHIRYVQEAGRKLGVPEAQLIHHDRSKFSAEEFPGYARHFHGGGDPDGFARAWLHHLHANEHHWQHWMFPDGFTPKASRVENGVVEMPEQFVREMVADWQGASMAYTGSWDMAEWLTNNLPKIKLHSRSWAYLMGVLEELGYAYRGYELL